MDWKRIRLGCREQCCVRNKVWGFDCVMTLAWPYEIQCEMIQGIDRIITLLPFTASFGNAPSNSVNANALTSFNIHLPDKELERMKPQLRLSKGAAGPRHEIPYHGNIRPQ